MAKFAQYYLQFKLENLFAELEKANRQKHFGSYFERNDSINFSIGEGDDIKTYKHKVYHLSINKDIIVMSIANDKILKVVQDFERKDIKHEPPCYVIIDNREKCRRIAIQKDKNSFNSTKMVADIITKVIGDKMETDHNIGIELHPQFYPRDFYKAWTLRQYTTTKLRFYLSEGRIPDNFYNEELDDDSIMGFAIKANEETIRQKYQTVLELIPPENESVLLVDEDSTYIKNLVRLHAETGAHIDIVTNDGARFTCFVDNDEESNAIITNEIDKKIIDALFEDNDIPRDKAELGVLEFVNHMKYTVDDDERKEDIA